jgi:hypothetical protein
MQVALLPQSVQAASERFVAFRVAHESSRFDHPNFGLVRVSADPRSGHRM